MDAKYYKDYYHKNKERILARRKQRYENDPEYLAKIKTYCKNNYIKRKKKGDTDVKTETNRGTEAAAEGTKHPEGGEGKTEGGNVKPVHTEQGHHPPTKGKLTFGATTKPVGDGKLRDGSND